MLFSLADERHVTVDRMDAIHDHWLRLNIQGSASAQIVSGPTARRKIHASKCTVQVLCKSKTPSVIIG